MQTSVRRKRKMDYGLWNIPAQTDPNHILQFESHWSLCVETRGPELSLEWWKFECNYCLGTCAKLKTMWYIVPNNSLIKYIRFAGEFFDAFQSYTPPGLASSFLLYWNFSKRENFPELPLNQHIFYQITTPLRACLHQVRGGNQDSPDYLLNRDDKISIFVKIFEDFFWQESRNSYAANCGGVGAHGKMTQGANSNKS